MAEIHKITKGGEVIIPETTTNAVIHPELNSPLTKLINEYNVSVLFPTSGTDGTDKYDLQTALNLLNSKLIESEKVLGTKIKFNTNTGLEEYQYNGEEFTNIANWKDLNELERKVNSLYLEQISAYGIEFDTEISSPTCTRIGNMELHRRLPIQSNMRGCLLDDNGNVTEYLPNNDWSSSTLDGSRGQVMVEIPRHWRKCETNGTKRRVYISEIELAGYHEVPKTYVSAYEATIERSTGKLCSVVNTNEDYRGGNNNSGNDGTYKSFLGLPVTATSRTSFRNAARKRNPDINNWNCYLYEAHKTLFWLFVIEYATLNSQAAFNSELTSEGFHQGGLGNGVTTWDWTSWTNFNGNYPFIPCGTTNSLGNNSGEVSYKITNDDESITKTFSVNRYRGIENPFGHIWKWSDGINVRINPTEENSGNGLSEVFICNNPGKFSDSGYDNYIYIGNEARTESYVKKIIFGEYGDIMPLEVGGSSSTYFCDYHYTNIPTTSALRGVLFGGLASSGSRAGLACAYSTDAPSYPSATLGSRLCFLPEFA